ASLPPIVIDAGADPALAALVPSLRLADARLDIRVARTRKLRELDLAPAALDFPPRGVVLITGGLGGAGFSMARHFARRFQARLALLGRRAADAVKLRELEAAGAEVMYLQADVSDEASLRNALASVRERWGRIDGVLHAAGSMGANALASKSVDEMRAVFAAKVGGTILLDRLTRSDVPRFVVLFSSLAATVGDFGHGDYAYANRFLSEYPRQHRGRILSIEWPLWAEGGMQFVDGGLDLFRQSSGMRALESGEAFDALAAALASKEPVVLVAAGDRERLRHYLGCEAATAPAPADDALLELVRGEMAALLRLDVAAIRPQVSFHEYGFDSMTLKEFASKLTERLGVSVSPAIFFARNTLAELTAHLARLGVAPHREPEVAPRQEPARDAIAIVGMHALLPGSNDLDDFWRHLEAGDDLVRRAPAERERLSGALPDSGFLDGVDRFDAEFFQIAPREAALMDPQQRLFLQTAWSALEDAAIAPLKLGGSRTAVFVGVQANDYASLLRAADPQVVTGTAHAVIANRLSFLLDLRGPSESIDTACSSSLVAIHRAVQSLRSGECDLAVAGGVNLLLSPATSAAVGNMGVLAPDGRCKVFARNADGYVRAEGVGAVVLKPLARALADGDPVRAVILGSGVAHGGRAGSLTAPSSTSQAELLASVWSAAGVAPESITYIEAHGTGTELGDPVEVDGVAGAFRELARRQGRALPAEPFCGIGSLKSNIGHLEPASGVAGLIKVVLAMEHSAIPPTLHCGELYPHLRLEGTPLEVVRERRAWNAVPRRAGVSSFGFGGVNAHLLIEEAPRRALAPEPSEPLLLPVSARSAESLRRYAEALARSDAPLAETAATLRHGRDAFEHQLSVRASTADEFRAALRDWLSGKSNDAVSYSVAEPRTFREIAAPATGGGVPRTHLPSYPFAGESHWHTAPRPTTSIELSASDWHLRDHVVQARRTLSAAAQLAIVHAARPGRLESIVWLQPLTVTDKTFVDVRFSGETFELVSDAGVHARGTCAASARPSAPRQVPASLPATLRGEELYARLASAGISYGDSFRLLTRIQYDDREAVGDLGPFAESEWELHPAILDAAFQTAAVLMHGEEGTLVPFALESIEIHAPLREARFTHAVKRGDVYDLFVLDSEGAALAELRGFEPKRAATLRYFAPVWEDAPLASSAKLPGRALIVRQIADGGLGARLRQAHGDAVEVIRGRAFRPLGDGVFEIGADDDCRRLGAFDTIHYLCAFPPLDGPRIDDSIAGELLPFFRLMRSGIEAKAVRIVVPKGDAVLGAFAPLCRSLAEEMPGVSFRTIAIDDPSDAAALLAAEPLGGEHEVSYVGGRRRIRTTREIAAGDWTPAAPPLREGGVYLIVGGAGGLGSTFARHLAERWKARLILTGRRPAADALLADIARLGGEAIYRAADAADPVAMRAVVAEAVERWGAIHGLVHSAIVLANAPIARMTDDDLNAALRPKAQGTAAVFAALEGQPLDFAAIFSSAISFSGGAGQSNYAAASGIQDALAAQWRARLRCPVVTIHWGFWGDVGIVATDAHRRGVARRGVASIGTGEGIEAFERILAAGFEEVMPIKLTAPPHARQALLPVVSSEANVDYLRRVVAEVLQLDPARISESQPHETLGIDSLVMMQITATLEKDLGKLPKTLFFETRNLGELAAKLPAAVPAAQSERPRIAVAAVPEAIAIVGMSGRFPKAANVDELWRNLRGGVDGISEVTRWDHAAHFDVRDARDKTYSRWGGFIDDVDRFDSLFFGISPREANGMDPQERLFLESVWSALEDAGHTRASLRDANVGVFAGVMHGNYQLFNGERNPAAANSPYWSIANRVSFVMDFHGPSLAVDTACSSSLAALHLACESIRRGECRAAIAGGVSLLLHPRQFVLLSQMKMLSRGARCRPFGDGADGIVVGEGVGAVLLRRLDDALRDGDRILGVIRASSMNAGGRTSGFTVPNPNAQAELIAETIAKANVPAETITFVEAHGTGTSLGDPIEVAGLNQAFRRFTPAENFCTLGSVKSNVGHLEAAAGIVALVKVLLQLRERTIAPTLHCDPPNPHLPLPGSPFRLAARAEEWRANGAPRRAGISSFGA
ncbi:MAG TPA: SDR family NAD(P)-dependent oxidoreductase, partial [Thermoanaerobaculia bacterium]